MAEPEAPPADRPSAVVPLPPDMCDPASRAAWADHVAAGRIGAAPSAAPAGDRGLAGLAAILAGVTHWRLP